MTRTLAFVILLTACSGATEPTTWRALMGGWVAEPGPPGYASAHIGLYDDPRLPHLVTVSVTLTKAPGGRTPTIETGLYEVDTSVFANPADFEMIVAHLSEFDLAKENCDGDNGITPLEPLCARYGFTSFRGGISADGALRGSFGVTSCTEVPFVPACGDGPIDLRGALTFRR